MNQDFTPEQLKAIERAEKLMNLANHASANEGEAANAAELANAILIKLNLSMDDLNASSAQDRSGRADDRLVGGFYQHERDLWAAISKLNFCVYRTVKVVYDAEKAKKEKRKYAHHHRLIGRKVNILASKIMADYLLQTIERLTREYCELERSWETYHPRSSTAVSFRKGATERLIEKIESRRHQILAEERRAEAERAKAAAQSGSTTGGTALVISGLIKSEEQGNYDFMNGEGAWAAREARIKKLEAYWAEEDRKHLERLENDEDYRKQWEKERKAEQRKANNRKGRAYREPKFKGDSEAFGAGYHKASDVGLDNQINEQQAKRIG